MKMCKQYLGFHNYIMYKNIKQIVTHLFYLKCLSNIKWLGCMIVLWIRKFWVITCDSINRLLGLLDKYRCFISSHDVVV